MESRRPEFEVNLIHEQGPAELVAGYRYRLIDDVSSELVYTTDPSGPNLSRRR